RDTLRGGAGNDVLIGSGDETTLEGGKGDDTLHGGSRSKDTYVFNLGDGNDLVIDDHVTVDSSRQSEIRFGAGIAQSDIVASQSG
ncbi:calcium-binding protein, partial [Chromobacterium subtsugae]|nr:calcium-binding protein [Chromobacterium subtsugae]